MWWTADFSCSWEFPAASLWAPPSPKLPDLDHGLAPHKKFPCVSYQTATSSSFSANNLLVINSFRHDTNYIKIKSACSKKPHACSACHLVIGAVNDTMHDLYIVISPVYICLETWCLRYHPGTSAILQSYVSPSPQTVTQGFVFFLINMSVLI